MKKIKEENIRVKINDQDEVVAGLNLTKLTRNSAMINKLSLLFLHFSEFKSLTHIHTCCSYAHAHTYEYTHMCLACAMHTYT